MTNIRKILKKINIRGNLFFDEPMRNHTTFRIGGPADAYIVPKDGADLQVLLPVVREYDIPLFIFGGGSNILVSDNGIRGIVLDMFHFRNITIRDNGADNRSSIENAETDFNSDVSVGIASGTGALVDDVVRFAAEHSLTGMEFLYGLPGSVGGALWMNARCYGKSIADILYRAKLIDYKGQITQYYTANKDFGYKHSPFQRKSVIILEAEFSLTYGEEKDIYTAMERNKADREKKGHYALPSAGSVFKNNRSFGKPSGQIIDELGLKGMHIGGAKISEKHANIIENTGNATASDIYRLIEYTEQHVEKETGLTLEREILLVGDW